MTNHSSNPHYDTERLNGVPFSSVVEWLDELKHRGCHGLAYCPWHQDSHPSLVLYENNGENHCHCFSCGNGGSVISYVMKHENVDFKQACEMLSQRFGIPVLEGKRYRPVSVVTHQKAKVGKPVTYVPEDYVMSTVTIDNSFCQCLCQIRDRYLVDYLTEEYVIGRYDNNWIENGTIFWTIDSNGNARNGKVQVYETDIHSSAFLHYDKTPGKMMWIGKQLAKEGIVKDKDPNFNIDCLFGEHLLPKHPNTQVMLVESPKNAIIGAAFMPQYLWVATGNKSALKRTVLEALRGRDVIVYADRDAIVEWGAQLDTMRDIANFHVSDFCERHAPNDRQKYDIADYLIEQRLSDL